jgi:hypothetical protein
VKSVRILSIYIEDLHGNKKVRRDFANLRTELAARGVAFEW